MSSRRRFLQEMAAIGVVMPASVMADNFNTKELLPEKEHVKKSPVCVFSKHLQFLDYQEMAEAAAKIGFDGVDIPVRPLGHVLPENVRRDLPLAVRAVENAGLSVPMITTAISDADDESAEVILQTAADLGVKYYRPDWFSYDFDKGVIQSLDIWKKRVNKLSELNDKFGMKASYQNHSGTQIGAAVWDTWYMLKDQPLSAFGVQFDIRHAVVEGGKNWPVTLRLIAPYINTLVIKDFYWGKKNGDWQIINVPVGEGMVNFAEYFQLIANLGVNVPISMHFEYPMTDKPEEVLGKKETKRQVIIKMKKDLNQLKSYLK